MAIRALRYKGSKAGVVASGSSSRFWRVDPIRLEKCRLSTAADIGAALNQPPQPSLQPLELSELKKIVDQLKVADEEAPKDAVQWMQQAMSELEQKQVEQAALMKRNWSDHAFEEGDEGNDAVIEGFEQELVTMLHGTKAGLGDAVVLGNAIDLAGAYKKNYKLDKAEAMLLRSTRFAEDRSGAWMVKYLNHISQVRMKQRRNVEAMEMMYEIESLATFSLSEPGASQFYETLYRNMSSCLRGMGREDEAAVYFMKMAEAARYHKSTLDWMDLWDLGLLIANKAFQAGRWEDFYKSRDIIAEALSIQRRVEPEDEIMRAKVLSNLGQCYLATKEHDAANKYYMEAYDLFNRAVGKRSPLFGMQAWACGNLRCAEGRHAEALPYLGEALYVEVVGDGLSTSEMSKLADQILMCLHELNLAGDSTLHTEAVQRSLLELDEDARWMELADNLELAVLAHKFALIHIAARWSGAAVAAARRFNSRASRILGKLPDKEAGQWLMQAEAIRSAVFGERASSPGPQDFR